ncbi:MAG: hypothetical protein HXK95_002785 [Candidatus Nanogingivalaceae bacterium]|nr:MAG: hypothetical protein HXK94_002775 [Candidatus Nanogingivalaceae bacterium]QWB91478.1 MAG: hypothetical protein HXK95_002785 [Candidatus Nanogingivalaceae bacterium]
MKSNKNFKKGGVSIFIVIVVGVLVSIMSASFLRLMFRDQEQASKLDLSQSAYDSAQAGVEDAKRFLRIFRSACGPSGTGDFEGGHYDCNAMRDAIRSDSCYVLATAGIGNANSETIIQTTSGAGGASNDASLNQAYTCVKLRMNTADFLGRTNDGSPSVINLRGTTAFNRVRIRWHSRENMTNGNNIALDSLSNPSVRPRIDSRNWRNQNRPAILKAQFYGYIPGVERSSSIMDTPYPDDKNGASEMLFYPVNSNSSSLLSPDAPNMPRVRRNDSSSDATTDYTFTRCSDRMDANSNTYACQTTVNIGRSVDPRDVLYLRLTPLMNDSNFEVELLNGDNVVDFAGVQPKVDSTGRANTQLRRVESRIGFNDTSFPVPLFSAQTKNEKEPICKDFSVTRLSNSNVNCKNQ